MGKHHKKNVPGTETQRLRPVKDAGRQFTPMEPLRPYVLRLLSGLAALFVVVVLVVVLSLLIVR